MIFWVFIVGIIITIIAVTMKVAVQSKKPTYTLAERDYAKLIVYQIMLGRTGEESLEFAKKSFIYYGCWDRATSKPTYAIRELTILRLGRWHYGKAMPGNEALQEILRMIEKLFRQESGKEEGVGLTNGFAPSWEDDGEIILKSTWELDISFWKSVLQGATLGLSLAVALVLGIVAGRWESLISLALSLISSFSSLGNSASSDVIDKYLVTAEQAYTQFGNVDSEQAQSWMKRVLGDYSYSKYGVEIEWS